jgi:hypothetical protein
LPRIPVRTPQERVARLTSDLDDLLDEIDEVIRASLGLDKNAPDELVTERAATIMANHQQKGGE